MAAQVPKIPFIRCHERDTPQVQTLVADPKKSVRRDNQGDCVGVNRAIRGKPGETELHGRRGCSTVASKRFWGSASVCCDITVSEVNLGISQLCHCV